MALMCAKCGNTMVEGAAFCPHCGERVAGGDAGPGRLIYQAEVKRPLRPAGKLMVYSDRTEYVTSSVQKAVFNYTGLVSVKKGRLESIDFITEDGRTESCPVDRKCIHEAFLYIEQAVRPYLAQRREQLLTQGVRYSFPSSQGLLNDGVLNLSVRQAEFKAKSGKSDVVPYEEVKSVNAPGGTLDFLLFNGGSKSFAVGKELREEVLAFVRESVAPYLARRKEELLARGIYFSSFVPDGGTVNVLADRVEYQNRLGQAEPPVFFRDVRAVGLYSGALELALTDGTAKNLPVEEAMGGEVLAFVREAIAPYVAARTVGFDTAFGVDERLEFNGERGVFHILRQSGREITGEWPVDALRRCAWTENRELTALGSVVSSGISLFKSATKAAGSQPAEEAEEWISSAGVVLTLCGEQEAPPQSVWFGLFPTGLSRTNKKLEQYLAEWDRLADYLRDRCPACELIEPVPPVIPAPEVVLPEPAALPAGEEAVRMAPAVASLPEAPAPEPAVPAQWEDLGITKYIEGVNRFIGNCPTPMTIAFQGNRTVGGSSILRMLYDRLKEHYGDNLLWLNAKQLPQGCSGEELSRLVGKRLVGLLSGESGAAKQTEALLTNLAAFVSGTVAGDSSIGKDVVGGFLNRDSADSPEELVRCFARQLEERKDKVVLLVDGLNLLAPPRAVELLEAARDFLDCKGCVFIIAADYADILSGARECFSESKAKGFFDGLFKMSFRVPASSYNMQGYVRSKVEGLGIRTEDEAEQELYGALVQASVGRDTEAIDRLFVSFQLLQDMTGEDIYVNRYKRLALFAMLCMQTRFRAAYDYAMERKDSVTPEFLAGLCGESTQPWDTEQQQEEREAYRSFGRVLARVVNLDDEAAISQAECQAFGDVLELSGVTYR
ncbi:MAG: zinc-ribbon domain-containing protein [Angelakisella sp.]|jgi:hypothetical protein|nr:zinc-ribbon domain-containing protein [Angelakisella sp.]